MRKSKTTKVTLNVVSVVSERQLHGDFVIDIRHPKHRSRTKHFDFSISQFATLNDVFMFEYKMSNLFSNLVHKKTIIFEMQRFDENGNTIIATWSQSIADLKKSEPTNCCIDIKTKDYGKFQIVYSLNRNCDLHKAFDNWEPIKWQKPSQSSPSSGDEYQSFFETKKPEVIESAPALSIQLINSRLERCFSNTDKVTEIILSELKRCDDGSIKSKIYSIVSGIHIVSYATFRKIIDQKQIDDIKKCIEEIFIDTCEVFIKEMEENYKKSHGITDFGTDVCMWLINNIGTGYYCQTVFTAILFALSCDLERSSATELCSACGVIEKRYLDLLQCLPKDESSIYQMISKVLLSTC